MEGASDSQKFAEELHWCINQLELGLQRQSPNSRQVAETMKVLKILRSTKAPMVKKRQAMRNALGDYRKKMKEAEKKSIAALRQSRFQPVGNMKSPVKSRFLRQSHNKQLQADSERKELNKNLNNLHLQHAADEPSCSTSSTVSMADGAHHSASSSANRQDSPVQVANLPSSSDDVSMISQNGSSFAVNSVCLPDQTSSSNRATLGLSHDQGHSSHIESVAGGSKSNSMHQTPEHASSSQGSSSSKQMSHSFKFAPSDNSFQFEFGMEESGDSDIAHENRSHEDSDFVTNIDKESSSENTETSKTGAREKQNISKNFYKFEKSGNDFSFHFEDGDS